MDLRVGSSEEAMWFRSEMKRNLLSSRGGGLCGGLQGVGRYVGRYVKLKC